MRIKSSIKDETFNTYTLKKLLHKKIIDNYKKLETQERTKYFDKYLIENYSISITKIINDYDKWIREFKDISNTYLEISAVLTIYNSLKKYSDIILLIDNGNLNIKGIHLFDSAFKWIQNNLDNIYQLYIRGGLNSEY